MTTKIEYLKKCIRSEAGNGKPIENRDWYVICFALPVLKETKNWETDNHLYDIVTQPDGLYFVDLSEDGTPVLIKIEDYKKNEPLFRFQDDIEIDSSWLSNVKEKTVTKIGRLIINTLAFYMVVGDRLPYVNVKMKQKDLESMIVAKVKDTEDMSDGSISVKEMISCIDRLNFFMSISTFVNMGASVKTITPPTGVKEYKAKLVKEYGDRLTDPVVYVEFEKKLKAFDKDYLGNDTAAATIVNAKAVTARSKMFLTLGRTLDFEEGETPNVVVSSLIEGIDNNKEDIAKGMNDLRYGSFSRGSNTALAGYAYKILQRALSGVKINTTPCATNKGYVRLVTDSNYKKLLDRYIKEGKWKLVASLADAKQYIGKRVEFRSSMYCLTGNNSVCYACMSESYKNSESGVTNLAANISSTLLVQFLKQMHSVETLVTDITIDDICS